MNKKGILFVITGPSGVGKGTVLAEVRRQKDVYFSISATTRQPREGEQDGVHYFFLTREQFEQKIAENGFLEHAEFSGNCYGTPAAPVDAHLEDGTDVILEIEVQGALKVMEKRPDAVFVFIAPPSMEELKSRIVGRNTETDDVIDKRMETAKWEVKNISKYTYAVVNDDIDKAARKLKTIVDAERLKVEKINLQF